MATQGTGVEDTSSKVKLWIHIESHNGPEEFCVVGKNLNDLRMQDVAMQLSNSIDLFENLNYRDLNFVKYSNKITPIELNKFISSLGITEDDPLVVRYVFSKNKVKVQCHLGKKTYKSNYNHSSGIWYILRQDLENKWPEKFFNVEYYFTPHKDKEELDNELKLNTFVSEAVESKNLLIELDIKYKNKKPYSDWKTPEVLKKLLNKDDISQLEQFQIDVNESYVSDQDLEYFVRQLKEKFIAFKTVNQIEATVREYVAIYLTVATNVIIRNENTDLRLCAELDLDGTLGHGTVDYAHKVKLFVRLIEEAKQGDLIQGIGQNLIQLHSAVQQLEKEIQPGKRKAGQDLPGLSVPVYGIVTSALQWYFIEFDGSSENPQIKISERYRTLDYSNDSSMDEHKKILYRIIAILLKHVRYKKKRNAK